MKKIIALACACACASALAEFSAYVDVTIASGYTGGTVTDGFPVLVKVDNQKIPGFYAAVQNSGADLKFTDSTGVTEYPYEIDTWDDTGTSLIWVRLPSFSSNTEFRMYYGDADVTTHTWSTTDVWAGYDLVCHLSDAAVDSSANDVVGMTNPLGRVVSQSKIGTGYGMAASGSGAAVINHLYQGVPTGDLPDFSASCWVRYNEAPVAWRKLFGPGSNSWGVSPASPALDKLQIVSGLSSAGQGYAFKYGAFTTDVWIKFDAVFSGTTMSLYVDGTCILDSFNCGAHPQINWVKWTAWGGSVSHLGSDSSKSVEFVANNSFGADFDECRIYGSAANAARVAADYFVATTDACEFGEPHGSGPVVTVAPNGIRVY